MKWMVQRGEKLTALRSSPLTLVVPEISFASTDSEADGSRQFPPPLVGWLKTGREPVIRQQLLTVEQNVALYSMRCRYP